MKKNILTNADKQVILKQILVYALGLLTALKDNLITLDELHYMLFRPPLTFIPLENKKCNKMMSQKIRDILEEIMLLENIYEMKPNKYNSELDSFIIKIKEEIKKIEEDNSSKYKDIFLKALRNLCEDKR